jgi:putative transferase (TIGR04331 family)
LFLATTANQDYWKTDEKILFLGEWCKIYNQKHIWSNLDHETIPSHWDEWEKRDQREAYLDSIHEEYLENLASNLNNCHRENHSLRYWRIILGPWLSIFIGVVYDRYLSVKSAVDSHKVTNTWIPSVKPERWVPKDPRTFLVRATENDFNLHLYSRIITKLGQISFEYKEDESFLDRQDLTEVKPLTLPQKIKITSKNLLADISKSVPDRFNQIVFSTSSLSVKDLLRLQLSLGQLPYFQPPRIVSQITPVDKNLREGIKLPQGTSEFESLLSDLIVEQLPTSFLEGYSTMRKKSLDAFPRSPKVIFTSIDFAFNDGFKFWTAAQVEQGAKVVFTQHGGGYGIHGPLVTENYELKICDKYFTWGWSRDDQPKAVPMASGKLSSANYNIKSVPNGTILWVTEEWPIFYVRIDHITTGFNGLKYYLKQECFLNVVCPEVFEKLLMRLTPKEYGWGGKDRLANVYPSLKLYRGTDSMLKQLQSSQLCIHDFFGTTWLETLSMNFPTLVFCCSDMGKLTESVRPYLDDLRRVKILHDTPESAAKFVNEIYKDPLSWWISPEVQQAKDKLCYQYARKSKDWLVEWKKELLRMVR